MSDNSEESNSRVRLVKGGTVFGYPVSALRTEQRKGQLVVIRVAGKDYVTQELISELEKRCTRSAKS